MSEDELPTIEEAEKTLRIRVIRSYGFVVQRDGSISYYDSAAPEETEPTQAPGSS